MSATTVSGWSEEKPKHVRDVASALRARVREEGCNSLEECERFRDLAEFTKLSWEILYTKNRRPARSFHHNERFRNMVRRAYHELEAEDDVAHTATSPPPTLKSPSPRRRVQRRKSTSRRARVDWLAPLKVLGMVVLVGSFGFMLFFSGVLVCDVCQENFERLASGTENVSSGSDSAPQ